MKTFLRILTIIGLAAVAAMVFVIVRRGLEKKGSPAHLRRIASQINDASPKPGLPGVTELSSATTDGHTLTINYTLLTGRGDLVDPLKLREVREILRRDSCAKPALREIMEAGAAMRYVIRDLDNRTILSTDILAWECGGGVRGSS
jgi:hypothetical protein